MDNGSGEGVFAYLTHSAAYQRLEFGTASFEVHLANQP